MSKHQVTCYSQECELPYPHREGSLGCQYHYQTVLDELSARRFGEDRPMADSDRTADARAINQITQAEYR